MLQLTNLVSLDLSSNPLVLQKPSLKDVVETFTHLDELYLSDVTISSRVPQSLSRLTSLSSLLLKKFSLLGEFPLDVFRLPNLRVLSLRYNPNLTGYLPEFDLVSRLEKVALDFTNFSGQLPVSIGNLGSLGLLSARKCSFGAVIPSSIGNLTNLYGLDLSENYFLGKIPSSLGNLFRLTRFILAFNNFSSGTLNWIGTLTNLQNLDMAGTNTFGAIPSSLGNLTKLTEFYLYKNRLTGPLPSWIGNFTQLIVLSIAENELQDPISELIFRLPNLEILTVQFNSLSGSLKYDSFLQMQHIYELELSANHLSIVSTPYINVTLPKFKWLGLDWCNLKEFPAFLRNQSELEILFLAGNKIEGHVPNWLFSLESLSYLNLGNNSLTGSEQPLGILSSPNLRLLKLSLNQFKGPLPFPSLSVIIYNVSHNKFSGQILALFCNLSSALSLDFSSNNLSGTLPPCLGNVALVLNLGSDSLSGAIPDSFESGCQLKAMDFSRNIFEGKVPYSLAKCSELELLNLNENQMNDVFPSWLGALPYLRVLSLRSNQFHGTTGRPLAKSNFGGLQIIDLSRNNLEGKLPQEYFRNWAAMKNVDQEHLAYMQVDTSFRYLTSHGNLITTTLSEQ